MVWVRVWVRVRLRVSSSDRCDSDNYLIIIAIIPLFTGVADSGHVVAFILTVGVRVRV